MQYLPLIFALLRIFISAHDVMEKVEIEQKATVESCRAAQTRTTTKR